MAASAILLVDDSCDGPAALRLPLRQLYALALVDYKTQRISSFEVCGHLKRVHADTVGALVTAFAAGATVHAASRRHPAGPAQAAGVGRLIPLMEEAAGTR